MDKLKELWNGRRGLVLLIVLMLVATPLVMQFYPIWLQPLLVAGGGVIGVYLLFELLSSFGKRKRQSKLDASIAAKEGIEDRKREWTEWTQELSNGGIDRYELPFYLLVGEPQSGKSIMLKNSGLHFPLGQSRLSGPGGTRGCDWWFTEEAVILDLAGRLFTHESGSSDATEWEAFLELLANYRPLSPANGVLLVIPCDSLLQDSEAASREKAQRIRESLLTLVNKLEAKLPIYVVLTKADKIFGFAESVHRLEGDKRRQMFGWSRPGENFENAFDLNEFRKAFGEIKLRAHLLRSNAMSDTKIPDALPEVDRLFAFPEELGTLEQPLEDYLRSIFTDASLGERLFFRGMYLTSGLQQGAPIAQACAALMGSASAADSRDLEGLFTKQRAYFIRDFIQRRVFEEQGLVRPTSERVKRSRKNALLGYGSAAVLAVAGALWMAVTTINSASPSEIEDYKQALESTEAYLAQAPEEKTLGELLQTLDLVQQAIETKDLSLVDMAGKNNISDFKALHRDLCSADLAPLVRAAAEGMLEREVDMSYRDCSFAELQELAYKLDFLLGNFGLAAGDKSAGDKSGDFSLADDRDREALLGFLMRDESLVEMLSSQPAEGGESVRPSALVSVIQTHLNQSSEADAFGPSWDGQPSATLVAVGAKLSSLFEHFLASPDFGGGLQVEPDACTSLERLALLFRIDQSVSSTAQRLKNPDQAMVELGATAPSKCDLISEGNALLQKGIDDVQRFKANFTRVSAAAFSRQLGETSELLQRTLVGTGNQLPASWQSFDQFSTALFQSSPGNPAFISWSPSTQGAGPEPLAALLPLMARGRVGAAVSLGGAENFGEILLPARDAIYDSLELNESEIAQDIVDCREEVLQAESAANPMMLMEFVHAKRKLNAESGSAQQQQTANSELCELVVIVQSKYANLYAAAVDDDASLAKLLPGAEAGAQHFGLNLKVLNHLQELRHMLTELDPDQAQLSQWSGTLDSCVQSRLGKLSTKMDAASAEECAAMGSEGFTEAMAQLSSGGAFGSELNAVMESFFSKRRAGLLASWQQATPGKLLAGLYTHLKLEAAFLSADSGAMAQREARDAWLRGDVNTLLAQGIDQMDQRIRVYWEARARMNLGASPDAKLRSLAAALATRLDPKALATDFANQASSEFDFAVLIRGHAKVQDLLGAAATDAPAYLPGASALGTGGTDSPLSAADSLGGVVELLEIFDAKELLSQVNQFGAAQPPVALLAEAYGAASRTFGRLALDRQGDGAKYYLRVTLQDFQASLLEGLRTGYIDGFTQAMKAHSGLLASPVFQKDSSSELDLSLLDHMQGLLGDIAGLHQRFGRTGAQDQLANQWSPFDEGSAQAEWDEFLYGLALYFDAEEGGKLGNKRFPFVLSPRPKTAFWKKRGKLGDTTLDYWLPFGKSSKKVPVETTAKPQSVAWEFGVDREVYMAWSNSVVGAPDANSGQSFERLGTFSPLVLAWHFGQPDKDVPNKIKLSLPLGVGEIPLGMEVPAGFPGFPTQAQPSW